MALGDPWLIGGNVPVDRNTDYLGTQENAPLIIKTNGEDPGVIEREAMCITAATPAKSARVGIGGIDPQQALSIKAGLNVDQADTNDGAVNPGITFGSNSGEGIASKRTGPFDQYGLDLYTGFATRMRITRTGSVAIGTPQPYRTLHVEPSEIHSGGNGAGFSFGNRFDPATGLPSPFTNTTAGNGERWVWYADRGQARLWSGNDKLAILPNGNVGIGMTPTAARLSVNGDTSIGGDLTVQGQLYVKGARTNLSFDGANLHWIRTAGDETKMWGKYVPADGGSPLRVEFLVPVWATGFWWTSDARAKTNIRELGETLDKLEPIRGVAFEWAESPQLPNAMVGQPGIGVVAQEVEEVFPELVSTYGDEDYKAVDYSGLTVLLMEAIKELKAKVDDMRDRIEALERA